MVPIKRILLILALGVLAALIAVVVRMETVPAPQMPDLMENRWGPAEPLKQQTLKRVDKIDDEMKPGDGQANP